MSTLASTSSPPPQGGNTCGLAEPVLQRFWWLPAVVSVFVLLSACGNTPPAPDWQMNARAGAERATSAWLEGNARIEGVEFARARGEVARTGRPDLLARLELMRCAARVASLDIGPCAGFEAIAGDAAPPEQAYARYLAGRSTAADAPLLPQAHRPLAGGSTTPEAALAAIEDPLSRLVAAGALFQRAQATPGVIAEAVDSASAQGWRRPLLAWLQVQRVGAQAAGATDEVARIQRRIDLVTPPPK